MEGHEGFESGVLRKRLKYSATVCGGESRVRNRRPEIRHDDGARKYARRVRKHARAVGAVAKVQVSVVRAGEGQGLLGIRIAGRSQPARVAGRARTPRSSSLR